MREITPQTQDALFYEISQTYDTSTYYVQAVVKNLITQEIVGTYNLDQIAPLVWHKGWTTPPDNSGSGSFYVVNYTVYEDSSYTTVSANYGQKAEYLRSIQPWTLGQSGSGGGFYNPEMDLRRITNLFGEFKNEFLKEIESKLYKSDLDRKDISQKISEITKALSEIKDYSDGIKADSNNFEKRQQKLLDSIHSLVYGMEGRSNKLKKELELSLREETKKLRKELQDGSLMRENQVGSFYKMLESKLLPQITKFISKTFSSQEEKWKKPEQSEQPERPQAFSIRQMLPRGGSLRDLLNENLS